MLIAYLNENDDAKNVARYIEEAGRKCVLVPGDLSNRAHCHSVAEAA